MGHKRSWKFHAVSCCFMLFEKETIGNVVMNFIEKICTDIGNVVREICGFT